MAWLLGRTIYSACYNKDITWKKRVCKEARSFWREMINLNLFDCLFCVSGILCHTKLLKRWVMGSRKFFHGTSPFSKAVQPCRWHILMTATAGFFGTGRPVCSHVVYKHFITAINQRSTFSDYSTLLFSVILTYPRYAAFSLSIIAKYLLHLKLWNNNVCLPL